MKSRLLHNPVFGLVLLAALATASCGSDEALLISPEGPTVVQKGTTLQFTTNKSGVAWSVEGGNLNGTIDADGLYTPPSTLPTGSPEINVLAQRGGDTAVAVVSLRTAEEIAFGDVIPVSQTVVATINDFGLGFMGNRLAVGLGSVHELSIFSSENAGTLNLFLTKALDLGDYQTPLNLTDDASITDYSAAIELDSELNPYILFGRGDFGNTLRLMLISSSDQGQSFGTPVPLVEDTDADNDQMMTFMAMDANENLHVVFSRLNTTNSTGAVLYTRSGDKGATWMAPVTVQSGGDELIFPALAVSPDGNIVYVSYFNGNVPNLFLKKSTNGGTTFGSALPMAVDNTGGLPPFAKLALDPEGNVYIAFAEDKDDNGTVEVVLRRSEDGGASFSESVKITNAPANTNSLFANIAIDDLGRIDVIWSSDTDGSVDLFTLNYARSLDKGETFSDPETVDEGVSGDFLIPRGMRHDESGRLYIQYIITDNFLGGSGEVFSKRAE